MSIKRRGKGGGSWKESSIESITDIVMKGLKGHDADYAVGWFGDQTYQDGTPVPEVARMNEYGTHHPGAVFYKRVLGKPGKECFKVKAHDVPPRPMLEPTKNKYRIKALNLVVRLLSQDVGIDKALEAGANFLKGKLVLHIANFSTPPNSALTEYIKGSSHPLIDTGYMKSCVTVRKVKKK